MAAGAPAERWQQFNALVKSYAVGLENNEIPAGLPVLSFIDSYEGLLAVGNSPTLYASDIIHLSTDGYSYWNTWVDTTIDVLMSEEGSDCAVWLSNECELFLETSVESPSLSPSETMTNDPSSHVTVFPTFSPSKTFESPSMPPSETSTEVPSSLPTKYVSGPTDSPSKFVTDFPTLNPSKTVESPSMSPSKTLSDVPSAPPTEAVESPSMPPSETITVEAGQTEVPSSPPTRYVRGPTDFPSTVVTNFPTFSPTETVILPSSLPSGKPTESPSSFQFPTITPSLDGSTSPTYILDSPSFSPTSVVPVPVATPVSAMPLASPVSAIPVVAHVSAAPILSPVTSPVTTPVAIPIASSGIILSCTGMNLIGAILYLGLI